MPAQKTLWPCDITVPRDFDRFKVIFQKDCNYATA